jgi:thiamine pyrophosphate-dependent acetolactate synthase large subunit-like protein
MDGGRRIADALAARGVRVLFTLCGGHISPILVGAKKRGIRVVDVRDEATAVFAADATGRLSGTPGVAAVTAGPGVTNAITALKNAQLAQSPLVLIGGAAPTVLRGRGALQDIDHLPAVRPHVKWAGSTRRLRDVVPLLEAALAESVRGVPGPVFLECPVDLLYDEPIVRSWYDASTASPRSFRARVERWYVRRHLNRLFAGPALPPGGSPPATPGPPARDPSHGIDRGDVRHAADLLGRAERPVLLVGSQATIGAGVPDGVTRAVAELGVPAYLSGMARGLLGRSHPLLLRHARRQALREADLVLLAGVPCDFRLDYGRQIGRSTVIVAANRSRAEARRNRRPAVTAVGDVATFLAALAAGFAPRLEWNDWLAALRARDAARDDEIRQRARARGAFVNPLSLCQAVEAAADDDSVFVLDGGDFAATASYILSPRGPLRHLDPGVFGTLGAGAGFALGAKLHRPGAEVWILYGDGAAAYSLAEFDSFVRHGLPVIAVVGNDASWAQIAREQRELLGDDVGTVLRRTDYDVVARGYGGRGFRVERPEDLGAALADAKAAARAGEPALVNVLIDPTDFRTGSVSM